jgi:hypothetical protein
MLHPLTREYFFNNIYQNKAMILKANPANKVKRFEGIIKNQMYGLDYEKMLDNSSS